MTRTPDDLIAFVEQEAKSLSAHVPHQSIHEELARAERAAKFQEIAEALRAGRPAADWQQLRRLVDATVEDHAESASVNNLADYLMRSRLLLPAPAADWHPIATAPKDGTWILVLDAEGRQHVAQWEDDADRDAGFYQTEMGIPWPCKGWQPLPPAPAEAEPREKP
jgi:hypothetical protein